MIHLQNVSKRFGNFTAVDEVSLHIEEGTVYGILGANGAGKTTLMKIMCGLLHPTTGSGRILDYELGSGGNEIKRHIGYMSQKFSLYHDLTVGENLLFYARLHGVARPKERAKALAAQFDIGAVMDNVVYSLSSGVRQRVAFACALTHVPKVLFLDEPTSGVDPRARRSVWRWLYRLAANGMTIVVTTHYMDEAEHSDRVALMNKGKIAAEGTPSHLRSLFKAADARETPSLQEVFVRVMQEEVRRK